MNINDLTVGQAKELAAMFCKQPINENVKSEPCEELKQISGVWEVGKNYLIRTVTMIDTGKLLMVTNQELVLEDAAWIPDTGRYADAIKSCKFSEVEPYPAGKVIINRSAIIDAVMIENLPRDQK
jgi:hypothetical protein